MSKTIICEVSEEQRNDDFSCSPTRVNLCGPLMMEKEKYAKLEEQLKSMSNDENGKYRKYFFTLLNNLEFSFQFNALLDIFKMDLSEISELKTVYYFAKSNRVTFWVFFENRNWTAEDQVYEAYERLLSIFPKYDVTLKILRLDGRKPEELLPIGGFRILGV